MFCQTHVESEVKEFRDKHANFTDILGIDTSYFYTREWYLSGKYYSMFNLKSGELISNLKHNELYKKEYQEYGVDGHFTTSDGFYSILSAYHKKKESNEFIIQKLDFVGNNNINKIAESISIPKNFRKSINTDVYTSGGNEFLLCLVSWFDKNTETLFASMYLFDSNFNSVFSREVKYESTLSLRNITLDKEGSIYFRRVAPNSEHYIASFDANREFEYWETKIDRSFIEEEHQVVNVNLAVNSQSELLVSGIYVNDKDIVEKLFYQKYDGFSKELKQSKAFPFNEEFTREFISKDKSFFRFEPKVKYFNGLNYYFTTDNDLIIVAEDKYTTQERVGETAAYRYTDHFNDIIVIVINSEDELVFSGGVHRSHSKTSYGGSSPSIHVYTPQAYACICQDANFLFLYRNRGSLQIKQFDPNEKTLITRELNEFEHEWPIQIKTISKSPFSNKIIALRRNLKSREFKYSIYTY
jgi:hypothetical protein